MRAKTRSGFVMTAHAVGHDTPYLELFPFEQVPGWVARVLRLKNYLTAVPGKALAERFAVDRRDHNVAWLRLNGAIHDHEVAWVDAGTDHRVALYTH